MDKPLDEFSKSLAQGVARKGALRKVGVGLAGMLLACFGLAQPVMAQVALPVLFDNTPDDTLASPYVGSGTFAFTTDPGNGTFPLANLGATQFAFSFDATTFTGTDLQTPSDEVMVILSGQGAKRQVQFSNTQPFGSGPLNGSLDFVKANGDDLSFEAPGYGGSLSLYFADIGSDQFVGNYASVPEPSILWGALGLSATGSLLLRRRR